MLKKARQEQIIQLLQSKGAVEVSQLCRIFGTAEMTIRRDLDELVAQGVVVRTHGGAVLSENNLLIERPFDVRQAQQRAAKQAIAKAAAGMIKEGYKIILDSGTTTFALARMVDNSKRIIAVTNAINIASELIARTNVSVLAVGGSLRANTLSCVGHIAENTMKEIKVDLAFLGVGGIGEDGSLTNASPVEVGIKRAIMAAAKQRVVLADSSKIGREEFSRIADLRDVDCLITDPKAPKKILARYRKMGVHVTIARM